MDLTMETQIQKLEKQTVLFTGFSTMNQSHLRPKSQEASLHLSANYTTLKGSWATLLEILKTWLLEEQMCRDLTLHLEV